MGKTIDKRVNKWQFCCVRVYLYPNLMSNLAILSSFSPLHQTYCNRFQTFNEFENLL